MAFSNFEAFELLNRREAPQQHQNYTLYVRHYQVPSDADIADRPVRGEQITPLGLSGTALSVGLPYIYSVSSKRVPQTRHNIVTVSYYTIRSYDGAATAKYEELLGSRKEDDEDKVSTATRIFASTAANDKTGIPAVSDALPAFFQGITGSAEAEPNGRVCVKVDKDVDSLPGLQLYTCHYFAYKMLGSVIVASKTYEVVGSRDEGDGDLKNTGTQIFVSTDGTSVPVIGVTFAGDSGAHGRICVKRDIDTRSLPGRGVYTCHYEAPEGTGGTADPLAAHEIKRRSSVDDGVFQSHLRVLMVARADVPALRPSYAHGTAHPDNPRSLIKTVQELKNATPDNTKITLNYSTLTTQEWMLQNLNQGLMFRSPAATAQQRILDLDGVKLTGGAAAYPRSHYVIEHGENVSILPKHNLMIRAAVDSKGWVEAFNPFLGYCNSVAFDKTNSAAETLMYMGTSLEPIQGDRSLYWMTAHFLEHAVSWNQQCYVGVWERRKIWVDNPLPSWALPDGTLYFGRYAGVVDVKLTENKDGTGGPHPGERFRPLLKTHNFTPFNTMIVNA